MSSDPSCRHEFGPFLPNVAAECPATGKKLEYNSIPALEAALNAHGKNVAAFIVEPIQGEAGFVFDLLMNVTDDLTIAFMFPTTDT